MIISSRTPEGDANQCPICGHHVRLEPSMDTRDAPCPRCGHLLWFGIGQETDVSSDRIDLIEAEQKVLREREKAKELALKIGELRFGPLDDGTRMELDELSSKFEKVEVLDLLLELNSWQEVVSALKTVSR